MIILNIYKVQPEVYLIHMSLKINYLDKLNNSSKNMGILVSKDTKINDFNGIFKENIAKKVNNYLIANKKSEKNNIYCLNEEYNKKIIIIFISKVNSYNEVENLGAKFYDYIKKEQIKDISIVGSNSSYLKKNIKLEEFIHGAELKSYNFNLYKTKKNQTDITLNIIKSKNKIDIKLRKRLNAILAGVNFTRDLVSEPGNVLHPDEYAIRITKLRKFGLKVTIYDQKKLKKMGCNALLGVGQGSIRGSYLAIVEWRGLKNNSKPLAFVGKGVCFDTGGYSLKPAKFMEDMTYDMAGSAAVVGLMKTLALRKSKVNAVGVVGLVENMVSGNAQRPGDIVKSYSGKTIEILNTDAEGRLVLADALTFTEQKFKPQFIVDLATLTGAIIVSLGSEYAGLFSNNDKLSKKLIDAGEKVDEKLWRMPLHKNFDKLINSKNADMQNINYVGGAGSTTAAQFLQRFVIKNTPWAHLDIAGMAFSKYGGALNSSGATGYGVRLLNNLVEENYE